MSKDKIIRQTLEELAKSYNTAEFDSERESTDFYAFNFIHSTTKYQRDLYNDYVSFYAHKKFEYKTKDDGDEQC